nr:hypothetical protein [Pseudoalteromonas byunsanensis]
MSVYLVYLLVTFALFGTAASYFVRFLYCYWIKKRIEMSYIWYAGGCALSIVIISVIGRIFIV